MRPRRRQWGDGNVDLTGIECRQQRRISAIWDSHDIDPSTQLEHLHRQVQRIANPRRAVGEAAGLRLRQRDHFGQRLGRQLLGIPDQ